MTWVIGTDSPFGFSLLASDVCVTFETSRGKLYVDFIQKIYPVGNFVVAGFSGSVKIGFRLIEMLKYEFSKAPQDNIWQIDIVANTWLPRMAKRIFKSSEKQCKKLRSSLIIASIDLPKKIGNASISRSYIHKFVSPEYLPVKAKHSEALSIGSGNAQSDYMKKLLEVVNDRKFLTAFINAPEAKGFMLAYALSHIVRDRPEPGISPYFQCGLVKLGSTEILTKDERFCVVNDSYWNKEFPDVVKSYNEYAERCNELRVSADDGIT